LDGIEGAGSSFHVLLSRTYFRWYRGRREPFSCFVSRTHFRRYRGRAGSRFHVLCSRTRFRRYRGRRVTFSCFALLDPFSAVSRAPGPVFMFCALGPVFNGTEGVGFHFHVLRSRSSFRVWRSRTRFGPYRGRQVPYSCFAFPYLSSTLPRESGPIFMFYASGLILGGRRAAGLVFMFCAAEPVFGGTEGPGSRFHVLRTRNRFRTFRGHRVLFLCFALLDSFSTITRVPGPVFMFCPLGLILGGTECAGSRFHVLRSRTHFRRYRERRISFSCFALTNLF
jgi:hypothetical protein